MVCFPFHFSKGLQRLLGWVGGSAWLRRSVLYFLRVSYANEVNWNSHPFTLRRRLRQNGPRASTRAEVVHGGEIEDQGRCDEGDEDGADIDEGEDKGEALRWGSLFIQDRKNRGRCVVVRRNGGNGKM